MKNKLIDLFVGPVLFLTIVGMIVGVIVVTFVWAKDSTKSSRCESLRKRTGMEIIHEPWIGCLARLPDGSYVPFNQIRFTKETK